MIKKVLVPLAHFFSSEKMKPSMKLVLFASAFKNYSLKSSLYNLLKVTKIFALEIVDKIVCFCRVFFSRNVRKQKSEINR